MSFFSEEQAAELRELFFESSQEILQELNDAGLLLEQYPADSSALARVRRAMHTLKGDSAACGFQELSKLAHELEDLFTPELVAERGAVIAEIVLASADSFHAMLGSYRGNMAPPDISELRAHIRKLVQSPESSPKHAPLRPGQEWSAEIREQILEALREGQNVYHVILRLDSSTQMPAAALQLITRAIEQCGTVLTQHPAPNATMESASQIDAAIVSSHSADRIRERCRVPGIVSEVLLQLLTEAAIRPRDALQVLLEAEASASPLSRAAIDSAHPESFSDGTSASSNAPSGTLASGESVLRVEARRIDLAVGEGDTFIGEQPVGNARHRAVRTVLDRLAPETVRRIDDRVLQKIGEVLIVARRLRIAPSREHGLPIRRLATPEARDLRVFHVRARIVRERIAGARAPERVVGRTIERRLRAGRRLDERIGVGPECADVAVKRTDVPIEGTDVAVEGIDVAIERVDVAVIRHDRVVGRRLRQSGIAQHHQRT